MWYVGVYIYIGEYYRNGLNTGLFEDMGDVNSSVGGISGAYASIYTVYSHKHMDFQGDIRRIIREALVKLFIINILNSIQCAYDCRIICV